MAEIDSLMSGRGVNERECKTELEAVWFASNYYYEASWRSQKEYGGVVFKRSNGSFGVTIRKGNFDSLNFKDCLKDMPAGATAKALWHTHLPETVRPNVSEGARSFLSFSESFGSLFGFGFEDFSSADEKLAERVSRATKNNFPIYLVTAKIIKRYSPLRSELIQTWAKPPPPGLIRYLDRQSGRSGK
jgi:hypothetical protein